MRTAKQIITETAREHGLTYEDILSRNQTKHFVKARYAAIRRVFDELGDLNSKTTGSLAWISRQFKRNHTTICYALHRLNTKTYIHQFERWPEHRNERRNKIRRQRVMTYHEQYLNSLREEWRA